MKCIRWTARVMILVTLGAGLACDSNKGGGPTTPPPPAPLPATISLQPVVGGFDSPVGMAQPPNDNRMFVVQKSGEIKVVKNGSTLATPFLDISGLLSTSYERGLLSMAFRPDYATSGRFYVCYTGADGDVTVARYHVSTGNPDVAAPTADEIVLRIEHSISDSHNGGLILFGPDGKMYVGVGDGHTGVNTGQDPSDMLGNILRIDVSGTSGYTNPSDNPYPGSPVWSWGLRNPWRFTFDRTTGDLYIADVGEIDREEVSVATAASGRGKDVNFGWSVYEGTLCRFGNCSPAGKTMPVIEYPHAPQSEPFCIIGGAVYRGTAISGLQGHYFYGDAFGTWLRSFKYSGGAATEQTLWNVTLPAPPLAFAEDHQGQIYILTEAGDILRIAP